MGILDSLNINNPDLMGLIQGLAQAGMPSRMPVPFGAAMGMGLQGIQQGRDAQMARDQAQIGLDTNRLGLEQNLSAINYYRQKSGQKPLTLADLSPGRAKRKTFGLSSDAPDLEGPPPKAMASAPMAPAPPAQPSLTAMPPQPMPEVPTVPIGAPEAPQMQQMAPPVQGRISSGFGPRTLNGHQENHNGIDYAVPTGTPVAAVGDGIVLDIGQDERNGNYLRIQHPDGSISGYAHLSQIPVQKGQTVHQGEPIALSGATGNATGPNVHLTVRGPDGKAIDPRSAQFAMAQQAQAAQDVGQNAQAAPVQQAQSAAPRHIPALDWANEVGQFNPELAMKLQEKWLSPGTLAGGSGMFAADPNTGTMEQYAEQPDQYTLNPGDHRFRGDREIASVAPSPIPIPEGGRLWDQASRQIIAEAPNIRSVAPGTSLVQTGPGGQGAQAIFKGGTSRPATLEEKQAYGVAADVPARIDAAGNFEVITGTGAALKPVPQKVQQDIRDNTVAIQQIDRAINLLKTKPGGMGIKNIIPNTAMQMIDPGGVEVRAAVADIGSLKRHDRSGAAVTMAETPILKPFIPEPIDPPQVAITKLQQLRQQLDNTLGEIETQYGEGSGYRPMVGAAARTQGGATSAATPAAKPAQEALPANARMQLKAGQLTTFGNGQVWTLKNGKPERVQ